MNLSPHYKKSLSAISLVALPLLVAFAPLSQVVLAQESGASLSLVAQAGRKAEADRLFNQGIQQYQISQFEAALQSWEQALTIYRAIKNRQGEGAVLGNLGIAYHALGKYEKAIEFQLQFLAIAREIKDRRGEGASLANLGIAYFSLGKYDKAIEFQLQSLAIAREIKDRLGEGQSIGNLGSAYYSLGKYDKAIELYLQLLAIAREIKNRSGEGAALGGLGIAYNALGKYDKAIEFHLQFLAIAREIKDRLGEGNALGSLGNAYNSLGKYDKAIEFLSQVLAIAREIKNRSGEGNALGNLGIAYNALGKYEKAIEFHLQSLAIAREIKDRSGEMSGLNNLAVTYGKLNRDQEAMISYQQALSIAREIGDRSIEGVALANLGNVLSRAKRPELAILFYKQSINVREAIRKDISKLDQDTQKSYLATVEKTYRNLADLLLKQDRILEAQQILDLLKVQELSGYFRSNTGKNDKGADYQPPEQNIIALGIELDKLQKADPLTKEQEQRLAYLTNQESDRNAQFDAFLNSPEVQKQIKQLTLEKAKNVDLEEYNILRTSLAEIKNAALFYPLILDDRLELILITATTTPIRKTITIKREDLNKDIFAFLSNLRDPSSNDVKTDGQKFYNYLIKPFEKELKDANIQTIIYSPDGQLRYIPLAALHDGKQWLVERYRINNITASSLTNLRPRTYKTPRVLAAAATNSQNIKVGDRSISFGALPATKTEVEAIAALIPATVLIDQQFNKIDTIPKMQSNTIIHLATHGYFAIGKPEDSFIVFGDGDKATIADMKQWTLTNVSLVILSACETAIGGKLGNGIEILGLGYQIQNRGAGAAIASLWKVSDDGTKALMEELYKSLKQKVSSSEALRQAQIAMINSDKKGAGSDRAGVRVVGTVPTNSDGSFSHPFYWSAFILIGNGL